MRNEDFTFRSPPFFFRSANQAGATWAGKMVYEEVCQDYKSFIAVQWGKKKNQSEHISLQVCRFRLFLAQNPACLGLELCMAIERTQLSGAIQETADEYRAGIAPK